MFDFWGSADADRFNGESAEDLLIDSSVSLQPPDRHTVSQIAALKRDLGTRGAITGMWNNDVAPYLVDPMNILGSTDYIAMIFAGPARCGKSDMLFNWIIFCVLCDIPDNLMIVHMKKDWARDWSHGDFQKFLTLVHEVRNRIAPGKKSRNTHDVTFMGGFKLLIKFPSITELSGRTITRGWCNDFDHQPADIGGEGNSFDLLMKRSETLKQYAMTVAESSPKTEILDPKWRAPPDAPHEAPPVGGILGLYNRGDRRRWLWRCPACNSPFEADWTHFRWPDIPNTKEAADQVWLQCPREWCPQRRIEQKDRWELNRKGVWICEGQAWEADGTVTGDARSSSIASFWLKAPAAALADWRSIIRKYIDARVEFEKTGDESALKGAVNTGFGWPYLRQASKDARTADDLAVKTVHDRDGFLPLGTRFLVASIDQQQRWFAWQVHAVKECGDMVVIERGNILFSDRKDNAGNRMPIDTHEYPEDYHQLVDTVLRRSYPVGGGTGLVMRIKATCLDMGGNGAMSQNAKLFYEYVRDEYPTLHTTFHLVKGIPTQNWGRIKRLNEDGRKGGNMDFVLGKSAPVLGIGTNQIKDEVDAKLRRTRPGDGNITLVDSLPGTVFAELTSEIRQPKGWFKPQGVRNESWDLLCYAYVLLHSPDEVGIQVNEIDWKNPPDWALPANDRKNPLVFNPLDASEDPLYDTTGSAPSWAQLASLQ